jgi:hypothetical protein
MTDGSSAGFRALEYSFIEYVVLNTTVPEQISVALPA